MDKRSKNRAEGKPESRKRRVDLADLPRDDFPLSLHKASGRWYKSVAGKRIYLGPKDDPDGAERRYRNVCRQLERGEAPDPWADEGGSSDGLGVAQGVNLWLAARVEDAEAGRIAPATLRTYRDVGTVLVAELGRTTPIAWLKPADFRRLALSYDADMSPSQGRKAITVTRQVFRWLFENEHIDAPPRFGSDFRLGKREARRVRDGQDRQAYTAEQVRALLDAAEDGVKGKRWAKGEKRPAGVRPSVVLRAMVLLGINAGFMQSEVAALRVDELDLDEALITQRRGKTGAPRAATLWPETVEALRQVLDELPAPKPEAEGLVFVTSKGLPWLREHVATVPDPKHPGREKVVTRRVDSVGLQFRKLAEGAGVDVKGAGFGRLRHTFRTVADAMHDKNAVRRIMGHDVAGVERSYILSIDPDRLRTVTDHVRQWLGLGEDEQAPTVAGRIGKSA